MASTRWYRLVLAAKGSCEFLVAKPREYLTALCLVLETCMNFIRMCCSGAFRKYKELGWALRRRQGS